MLVRLCRIQPRAGCRGLPTHPADPKRTDESGCWRRVPTRVSVGLRLPDHQVGFDFRALEAQHRSRVVHEPQFVGGDEWNGRCAEKFPLAEGTLGGPAESMPIAERSRHPADPPPGAGIQRDWHVDDDMHCRAECRSPGRSYE